MGNHKRGLTGARRRRRAEKRALDWVDGRRMGYRCSECGAYRLQRGAYNKHILEAHR